MTPVLRRRGLLRLAGVALMAAGCAAPTPAAPTAAPATPAGAAPTPGSGGAASPAASAAASPAPSAAPSAVASPSPASAAAGAIGSPGPASAAAGAVGSTTDKVSVLVSGVSADAAIYIALDRGYFREQGIDVDLQTLPSIVDILPQLATGKVDIGEGSNSAGFYNALANNIALKIVADNATIQPGRDGGALVARTEVFDQLRGPADLKGRKIAAIAPQGTTSQIYLEKVLAPAGLRLADIDITGIPFPDMLAALKSGAVDLAIEVEPFVSLGQQQGLFKVWKGLGEIYPGQEANVLLYGADFAAKRADVANRFMVARLRGARDFNDAFFKSGNPGRDQIAQILASHTPVKDVSLYSRMTFGAMDPNGKVGIQSLMDDQDWFSRNGFVQRKADLQAALDPSFANNAVHVLGPYQA